jgi:hypothetical protein
MKIIKLKTKLTAKFARKFLWINIGDKGFDKHLTSIFEKRPHITIEDFILCEDVPPYYAYSLLHSLAFNGLLSKSNAEWNLLHNSNYWKKGKIRGPLLRMQLIMILAYGEIVGKKLKEEV